MNAFAHAAVVIYDGECPLCRRTVAWIRARARPEAFEFLSCHADERAERFPAIAKEACLRAMHLVLPDGTVLAGERAVPEILMRLPRYRLLAFVFRLPGTGALSRAAYRWIAEHRGTTAHP